MRRWLRESPEQRASGDVVLTLSPRLIEEKLGNDEKGPDMKLWQKNKQLEGVDFSNSDWIFTPIIQSGGKYDLKVSAESNGENLKAGVVLASMGIKYKEYCSSIGRSFLYGPHKVSSPRQSSKPCADTLHAVSSRALQCPR